MKKIFLMLFSMLFMLSTSYSTPDQSNGRKKGKKITKSLQGETFRVFKITGTSNTQTLYTDYGAGTYLHMTFDNKGLEFYPDSSQNYRFQYMYELGDTQQFELKFKYNKLLTILVPSGSQDLTILKPINHGYGGKLFPISILAGDYYVQKGHITSGEQGYTLTSIAKNPYNNWRLVIELAIIE